MGKMFQLLILGSIIFLRSIFFIQNKKIFAEFNLWYQFSFKIRLEAFFMFSESFGDSLEKDIPSHQNISFSLCWNQRKFYMNYQKCLQNRILRMYQKDILLSNFNYQKCNKCLMSWQSFLNKKGNNNQEHTLFSCRKMNNLSKIRTFSKASHL